MIRTEGKVDKIIAAFGLSLYMIIFVVAFMLEYHLLHHRSDNRILPSASSL
jgi:hypothetical protein